MSRRLRAYLAGPDVFLPNAIEVGRLKKEICARHGIDGLFPFDNEVVPVSDGPPVDELIYRGNVAMMRESDCGIFNLTPFRGPGADGGTCFELGFMTALGKRCVGYTEDPGFYIDRVRRLGPVERDGDMWRDAAGLSVEDFDNMDNLMLDNALRESGHEPVRQIVSDNGAAEAHLAAFERCIHMLAGTAA